MYPILFSGRTNISMGRGDDEMLVKAVDGPTFVYTDKGNDAVTVDSDYHVCIEQMV